MAIVLHWLAQARSYSELAVFYAIGRSAVAETVHEGVTILQDSLFQRLFFPTGPELERVVSFEALCGLPFAMLCWSFGRHIYAHEEAIGVWGHILLL